MQYFSCAVIVLALYVGVGDAQSDVEFKLRQKIQDKCWKNSDNFFSALEISIASDRLSACMPTSLFQNETTILSGVNELCKTASSSGYYNVQRLVHDLSKCVEEEERYLSDFLLTTFNSTFEPLCGDNKLKIIAIIESFINGNCSNKMEQIGDQITRNCFNDLQFVKELDSQNFVYKQDDACSDIRKIKDCIDQSISGACGAENVVVSDTLFKSPLNWCIENELPNETLNEI